MVKGFCIHVVVFVVVNAVLVALWVLGGGYSAGIPTYLTNLPAARADDFWPIYVILLWGAALLIHGGVVLAGWPGRARRRRRQRQAARDDRRQHRRTGRAGPGMAGTVPAVPAVPSRPDPSAGPPGPIRRWVTVMFTDIVDSTTLNETLGDDAWSGLLVDHRTLVRTTCDRHGGTEVGTQGDGFLIQFPEPADAGACAVDLQSRLAARRTGDGDHPVPHLRIGIHAGEVLHDDDDLIGRVVNLAARVTDVADPDEILVTEPVADHLDPGVHLVDRGLHSLKGLDRPRHLLALLWQPTPDVVDLDATTRTSSG